MDVVKVNYKSDFKINEKSERVALEVPFVFSYYVFQQKKYVVSFDGHEYVNCERKEDGSLDVIFNQPDLGIGMLMVERKYFIDDKAFADGVFDVVTTEKAGVYLTAGASFENYIERMVVPPYLKGDKGDAMRWETMTDKEREEMVHGIAEAIDPEMVMTENEQARIANERERVEAEAERATTFGALKTEMETTIEEGQTATEAAQNVVAEYDGKVAEQDAKLADLGSKVDNNLLEIKPFDFIFQNKSGVGETFTYDLFILSQKNIVISIESNSLAKATIDLIYYDESSSSYVVKSNKSVEVITEKMVKKVQVRFDAKLP